MEDPTLPEIFADQVATAWFDDSIRGLRLTGTWSRSQLLALRDALSSRKVQKNEQLVSLDCPPPFETFEEQMRYSVLMVLRAIGQSTASDRLVPAILRSGWNPTTAAALREAIIGGGIRISTIIVDQRHHDAQRSAPVDAGRFFAEASDGRFLVCSPSAGRPKLAAMDDEDLRATALQRLASLLADATFKHLESRELAQRLLSGLLQNAEVPVTYDTIALLRAPAFFSKAHKNNPKDAARALALLAIGIVDTSAYDFLGDKETASQAADQFYDFLETGRWPARANPLLDRLGEDLHELSSRPSRRLYDEFLSRTAAADFLARHFGRCPAPLIQGCQNILALWLERSSPISSGKEGIEIAVLPSLDSVSDVLATGLSEPTSTQVLNELSFSSALDLAEEFRRFSDALCLDESKVEVYRQLARDALRRARTWRWRVAGGFRDAGSDRDDLGRRDSIAFAIDPSPQNETGEDPVFTGSLSSVRECDRVIRSHAAQFRASACHAIAKRAIENHMRSTDRRTNHILATFCALAWALRRVITEDEDATKSQPDLNHALRRARRLSVWAEVMVRQWEKEDNRLQSNETLRVFLSYKRAAESAEREHSFVRKVSDRLKLAGRRNIHPVYDMSLEEESSFNAEWVDRLFRWMFLAHAQICFVSDRYLLSEWCWLELQTALIRRTLQPNDFDVCIVEVASGACTYSAPQRNKIEERRKLLQIATGAYNVIPCGSDEASVDALVARFWRSQEDRLHS